MAGLMIYLGTDHSGWKWKDPLKKHLENHGFRVHDCGTFSAASVDYPLIAETVAKAVSKRSKHRGILLCGSGVGVAIAANKVQGIRAANIERAETVRHARRDDDVNVLCLGARLLSFSSALKLVDLFLKTPFSGLARYRRRLAQLAAMDHKLV